MRFTYCPNCSEKLISKQCGDDLDVPFCPRCNVPFFPHFTPCVIVLPVSETGEVALTRQSYGDTERYVLTAGFMKENESAEECCVRELDEELGLCAKCLKYVKSYPYQKRGNLMLGFVAIVEKTDFVTSCEVRDAVWVDLKKAEELLENSLIALKLLQDYQKGRVN